MIFFDQIYIYDNNNIIVLLNQIKITFMIRLLNRIKKKRILDKKIELKYTPQNTTFKIMTNNVTHTQ